MALEREFSCPECGVTRTFYLTARTTLHLGEKAKWACSECNYGIVRIDDVVDTSAQESS